MEKQSFFKNLIDQAKIHPELLILDALTIAFGAYTVIKFLTGQPVDGPSVVLTGGAAAGFQFSKYLINN